MARKLKVGDVVKVRSEVGPEMTVERIDSTDVACVWFDVDNNNQCPPGVLTLPTSMEPCPLCGQSVLRDHPRGQVHFPSATAVNPCPASWPGWKPRA